MLGALLFFEVLSGRRRGVRIRTLEGRSAELDTNSVAGSSSGIWTNWRTSSPSSRSEGPRPGREHPPGDRDGARHRHSHEDGRGGRGDHSIIEEDMGLKLGKLDMHMRCAPFDPEWVS